MVCCDRPSLFYLDGTRLEMQYMRESNVYQASIISLKPDIELIAFENHQGKITLGSVEP